MTTQLTRQAPLPDGYARMIRRARVALYEAGLSDRYERRLVERMTAEGWLCAEVGEWSGERYWRASAKAVARV